MIGDGPGTTAGDFRGLSPQALPRATVGSSPRAPPHTMTGAQHDGYARVVLPEVRPIGMAAVPVVFPPAAEEESGRLSEVRAPGGQAPPDGLHLDRARGGRLLEQ